MNPPQAWADVAAFIGLVETHRKRETWSGETLLHDLVCHGIISRKPSEEDAAKLISNIAIPRAHNGIETLSIEFSRNAARAVLGAKSEG